MEDRGFWITLQAIRRQLAAMPNELYLVRLIHQRTRQAFPGERLWTAHQLTGAATIRFLRARNREGCDVYVQPYAGHHNAGYVLVDLDRAQPTIIATMRAQGHDPCVVVQTSPGHWQAWIHLSTLPWSWRWRRPLANCWLQTMEAIWPAPTGVTWAGSPVSPIRSPLAARRAATAPG